MAQGSAHPCNGSGAGYDRSKVSSENGCQRLSPRGALSLIGPAPATPLPTHRCRTSGSSFRPVAFSGPQARLLDPHLELPITTCPSSLPAMPQATCPRHPVPRPRALRARSLPAGPRIPRIAWTRAIMPHAWLTKSCVRKVPGPVIPLIVPMPEQLLPNLPQLPTHRHLPARAPCGRARWFGGRTRSHHRTSPRNSPSRLTSRYALPGGATTPAAQVATGQRKGILRERMSGPFFAHELPVVDLAPVPALPLPRRPDARTSGSSFRPVALSGLSPPPRSSPRLPVPTCPSSLPAMPQPPAPRHPIPRPRALRARSLSGGRTDSQDRMDQSHHAACVVNEALARADVPVLRNAASLTGPSPRSPVPRSTSSPSSIWPRHPHRRSPTAQSPDLRLVFPTCCSLRSSARLLDPQLDTRSDLSQLPARNAPTPAPHRPTSCPRALRARSLSRGRTDSHHCTSPLNISLWLTDPFRRRRRAQRPPDEEGEVDLIGRDRWPRSGARHEKGAG